jgi:hypothetical protein
VKRRSPTIEGFRLVFRRPSFALAEIAWRWSYGAAVLALLGVSFLEYLDTLPVSKSDLFLLRSRHPGLIARALSHILAGSGPRFIAASIVLAMTLSFAWVIVASFGRAATLGGLVHYFWEKDPERRFPFRMSALFGLNFLRSGALLAAMVGSVGALVLGGMASSEKDPSPGLAMLIFLTVIMLVWSAWSVVNWVLSLASVFVAARHADTFAAITSTVSLCRERTGAVLAASTWFGMAHFVAFFVASSVIAFPLALVGVLPGAVVFAAVLFVTLLYFAVADWLYLGRLASYLWIVEGPEPEPLIEIAEEPPAGQPPVIRSIDRVDPDDLILSDVPVS